jgi:hypothetical protein
MEAAPVLAAGAAEWMEEWFPDLGGFTGMLSEDYDSGSESTKDSEHDTKQVFAIRPGAPRHRHPEELHDTFSRDDGWPDSDGGESVWRPQRLGCHIWMPSSRAINPADAMYRWADTLDAAYTHRATAAQQIQRWWRAIKIGSVASPGFLC